MNSNQFYLTIDYDKFSPNPEKIFLGISKMLEAFKALDIQLVNCVDNTLETEMLLEDVERGSIKLQIANILKSIPDDAIKDLDYKKIIGEYLVKGKYFILSKCNEPSITEIGKVEEIEYGIKDIAQRTGVNSLECYSTPNRETLLNSIGQISEAYQSFEGTGSSLTMTNNQGKSLTLNTNFRLDAEGIEKLCVGETIDNEMTLILKVRRPDFLANTLWDFKHGDLTIKAKIEDKNWLDSYLSGNVIVLPGDSLKAVVYTSSVYDSNQNLIKVKYVITKVLNIVRKPTLESLPLV